MAVKLKQGNTDEYRISSKEMLESKWETQLILSILKEKGAPILGTIYLTPDLVNYDLFAFESWGPSTRGDLVFRFTARS